MADCQHAGCEYYAECQLDEELELRRSYFEARWLGRSLRGFGGDPLVQVADSRQEAS